MCRARISLFSGNLGAISLTVKKAHTIRGKITPQLKLQRLGLFPGEVVTAEVAVGAGLLENRGLQLQILDNSAWPEVEVLPDDVSELCGCF